MKRLGIFFTAMLCSLGLYAQSNLSFEPVLLTIDRADGLYAAGEAVEVYGQLQGDTNYELVCEVEANGKVIQQPTPVELMNDTTVLVYSASFEEPTAVQVYVYPRANDKKKAAVGFIIDAEGLRPGFDVPEDFNNFWAKQLKSMRKRKMKPELTPIELPEKFKKYENKCELYALEINMHEGRSVHGYIAWPKNAAKGTLPIVVNLHGAGLERSNIGTALNWANRGCISIDMNAHGYPDDKPSEYYKELDRGDLKNYRNRKVVDHESFYFRLMYLRAVRAVDYATTLPLWDRSRIMTMGSSQGGGQAIAVAGIDNRVTAVYAGVPALTDLGGHLNGHRGGWPWYDKHMLKGDNLEAEMSVLPYYDCAVMIRHTKAKLWIEAGLIDNICPPECVISTFNVAASQDKTLYTFPYRPHAVRKTDSRTIGDWRKAIDRPRIKEIVEWLK